MTDSTPAPAPGAAPLLPAHNATLPNDDALKVANLSEVVQAIMQRRAVPFAKAARELCQGLKDSPAVVVYRLGAGGDLVEVNDSASFDEAKAPGFRVFSPGLGPDGAKLANTQNQAQERDLNKCGRAGLLRWLDAWGNGKNAEGIMAHPTTQGLVLSHAQAVELWGLGDVVRAGAGALSVVPSQKSVFPLADFAALVVYRAANKGKPWEPGNQIALVKAAVTAAMDAGEGKSKAWGSVATALNMKRSSLQMAVKRVPKKKTPQTFPSAGQLTVSNGQ